MTIATKAGAALGNPGVNNTAYLSAALFAAFAFWVTIKGDLPKWLGLFGLAPTPTPNAGAVSPGAPLISGASGVPAPSQIGSTGGGNNPLGISAPGAANPGVLNLGRGYTGSQADQSVLMAFA